MNGGRYASCGAEVSADVHLASGWDASFAYAYFSDPETSAGMPGQSLSLTAGYVRGPVRVRVTGRQVRELYTLSGTPPRAVRLESYGVLDARVVYRAGRRVQVTAGVDNLFDTAYETQYGYPMPGRTGRVGFELALESGGK